MKCRNVPEKYLQLRFEYERIYLYILYLSVSSLWTIGSEASKLVELLLFVLFFSFLFQNVASQN